MEDGVQLNLNLEWSRQLVNAEWIKQFARLPCAEHWGERGKEEPGGDLAHERM